MTYLKILIFAIIFLLFNYESILSQDKNYIIKKLKYHKDKVLTVEYSPNGECLISGSEDKTMKLYNILTNEVIINIEAHYAGVKNVGFFNNGNKLISAGDKSIKIWNLEGIQEKILLGHHSYILSFDVSPNNIYLASGSYEKYFRLWDINKGKEINSVKGHDKSVVTVSISPDNKLIASGSMDHTIKIWELETQQLIHTFEGHTGNILCLKFSNSGDFLLSASIDKKLTLWDIKNKSFIISYVGHDKGILSCDFSPNGNHFISAGGDRQIKLWETKTTNCIYTYNSHEEIINEVCYSPDGNSFASASNDKTIIIWEINPEIYVNYYYPEEFYDELEKSGLWGPKKAGESREEYKIREEKAEELKNSLIEKYHKIYLEELELKTF